jgi:glycosyltransferase involved in cell wall biosynthesis
LTDAGLKILDVISSIDPRDGGPSAGVVSSALIAAQLGHQRDVVCLDPPDAAWIAAARTKVFALGRASQGPGRWRARLPGARYGYTPRLAPWLKAHAQNYDAVVVNGLWNYASLGSWRAMRGSPTPYFLYTHGMLDPWFNRAYPIKTVFKTAFWKLFEHRVLRDARGVMFTCEEERRLASRSFAPYSAREFVVGYGAPDPEGDPAPRRAALLQKLPGLAARKFVLYLSRIHEKKGVDLLLRGFASVQAVHPDLDLVVAGPGEPGLIAQLQKLAADLGVADRVHWPGMLSGEAKWGAFGSAECFVLPSHQENFGVVVAEALAMAKPLLITNKVNIWREIEIDRAGIVVDDDEAAVTDGLRRLLALSPQERLEMGGRARNCFRARYDIVGNAKSFLALVASLLPGRQDRRE